MDEATASELQARARDVIEAENTRAMARARELGVEDSLVDFEGLTPQMIEALAEDGCSIRFRLICLKNLIIY